MNEPDLISYSPEQLRYARETLVRRAPEILSPDEKLLLRCALREPGAPAMISPPEASRIARERQESSHRLHELVGAWYDSWVYHDAEPEDDLPEERDLFRFVRQLRRGPIDARIKADAEQGDTQPREPGCQCDQEVGDSPCRVHGEHEEPTLELAPHEVGSPVRELLTAVERAASELHGQGAKSDRIALQLLTALARFEGEVGQ
ncbi:MAG TPA: hypothetical protein VKZ96_04355 [Thermomicrobiales bacterium]|nr:hypothetical protein [Thermomicrobiales bacterium]